METISSVADFAGQLKLLLEVATEAGLGKAYLMRGVGSPARVFPEPDKQAWRYHLIGQLKADGGLLVLLHFPQSDGGAAGIEEL